MKLQKTLRIWCSSVYVHCTTTMYRAYNEIIHIFWPATTSLRRGGGRIMAIHSDYYPKQQYAFTLGGDQAVVHVCVNTVCVWMWAIGWSDFWRKILGLSACFAELDLKSNIFLWNVAYLLGAGPHFLYLTCLKASPLNKTCCLVCLKAKNERRKKFIWPGQEQICALWGPNIKKIWIFFLASVLWSKREVFANQKILIFKVPVIIFKVKTLLRAQAAKFANFWEVEHNNITDRQRSGARLKNRKKFYITPP